jgi:hypothetical protein
MPMLVTAGSRPRLGRLVPQCLVRAAALLLALSGAVHAEVDWSVTASIAGLPPKLGSGATLSASPISDEVVWMTLPDGRVFVSTDAGLTWTGQRLTPDRVAPLPKPPPRQPPQRSFTASPRIAEGMPSPSQVLGFSALEASFDDPVGRPSTLSLRAFSEDFFEGRGVLLGARTDPAPGRLFAATARASRSGPPQRVRLVALRQGARAAIARSGDGTFWRTDDAGATWRPVDAASPDVAAVMADEDEDATLCGRRVGLRGRAVLFDGAPTSLDAEVIRSASSCAAGARTIWWTQADRVFRALPAPPARRIAHGSRPEVQQVLERALRRAGAIPQDTSPWLLRLAPSLHVGVRAQRVDLESTRRSAFSDEPGAGPGAFNRGPLEPFDATVLLRWDLTRAFEPPAVSAVRAAQRRAKDVERRASSALDAWVSAVDRLSDAGTLTPLARGQVEAAAEVAAATLYVLAGDLPQEHLENTQE